MSLTTRVGILAGAATLTLSSVGFSAAPADTDQNNLRDRLAAAEAKIAELSAANGDKWLTEQRAAEIKALVQDVLADADTRASLLQSGTGAGYDNGFWIADAAGNFSLKINGTEQVRFIHNFAEESGDDHRGGFENARTKLIFSGNVVNPNWLYKIEGDFARSGGGFTLLDAWIAYNYGNGWQITAGQFKLPLLREELIADEKLQAIERSNVNEFYTGRRAQGIEATWTGDQFRAMAAFSDGLFTANTVWSTEDTEFALTGRVEWMLSGDDWNRFNDMQSWKSDSGTAVLLGGAVHWQKAEYGTGAGTGFTFNDQEVETLILTADATIEFGGANLFGAVIYQTLDGDAVGTVAGFDAEQWGVVVQGGYFFTDEWEGFIRYEWSDFDFSGAEDLSLLTVGVTKYFAGNQLKWTTDVGYGFDEVDFAANITGWRVDGAGEDGQIVIRTQLQLLF